MGQSIQFSSAFITGYGAYSNQKVHVFLEDTLNSIYLHLLLTIRQDNFQDSVWQKINCLFSLSKVASFIKGPLHTKSMCKATFPLLLKN